MKYSQREKEFNENANSRLLKARSGLLKKTGIRIYI
jgi:hypothetical protein